MRLLLIAALLIIGVLACTAPQPAPTADVPATVTAQVQAHLDAIPTAEPLPTYTPYPTTTPYPTPTEPPTATPYPSATPRPTLELLPTYTPYPTYIPDPTQAPEARQTIVTQTPFPTFGPLSSWKAHELRGGASIWLSEEFSKDTDLPPTRENWGYASWSERVDALVLIEVEDALARDVPVDIYGMASTWLDNPVLDQYVVDVLNFELVSRNVVRASYRMTEHPEFCDAQYEALFDASGSTAYRIAITICDSVKWNYDEVFVARVLNSFSR